jgi:hypothetical protein
MENAVELGPAEVTVESVPAARTATEVKPGDFVLSRALGRYKHRMISWGQGLRLAPEQRVFRGYTHAALIVSGSGDLVEALGEGVRTSHLDRLVDQPYQVVHINACDEARERVVAVAMDALGRRARYNGVATVSIALTAFTGSRLIFFTDGAHTCSGLVARAMLAVGAVFVDDAAKVTPAQLAIHFDAPPPPAEFG